MGQTLVKNYVHIVFSTKNRVHLIQPQFEKELHTYIGGVCNKLDCPVLIVGGYTNHIHILCMLSKNITLVSLLQKIKSNSSKWFKTKDESLATFFWQDGYGSFSVQPNNVNRVIEYIKNQHEHHKDLSFKDEYLALLEEYDVEYDERYMWD